MAVNRFGPSFMGHLAVYVNPTKEKNLPTFIQIFMLTCSGSGAWLLSYSRPREGAFWKGLSLVLFFAVADELASFHERITAPLRSLLELQGVFYFAWVVPALVVLFILFLLSARTLLWLTSGVRDRLLLGFLVAAFGAIGLEMAAGPIAEMSQHNGWGYFFLSLLEEAFEFAGSVLILSAILKGLDENPVFLELKG